MSRVARYQSLLRLALAAWNRGDNAVANAARRAMFRLAGEMTARERREVVRGNG